jgi:hypothetical protein
MPRFLVLLLAGCGSHLTEIPDLPASEGCADVYLDAGSADGAVRVRFDVDGAMEAAYSGTTSQSWSADDPAIDLVLEQGHNLDDAMCTDFFPSWLGRPRVSRTWVPISGSVALELAPGSGEFAECGSLADAVLTLDDVVFQSPDGDEVTLDHLEVAERVGGCLG